MPYYPKSQVKTNLYTNGDEFLTPEGVNYKGYYYTLYTGKSFSGKNPQNPPNIPLTPIITLVPPQFQESNNSIIVLNTIFEGIDINSNLYSSNDIVNFQYSNLNKNSFQRLIPLYNLTIPTQKDYELGVFVRYFCKKNNELKYIEIDKKTHDLLKSKSKNVAWDLYSPISTLWYLTGNKLDVIKTNKGLISQIEKKQNWYGFSQYFKEDFSKYYLGS
jgi:hypothetical protein